MSNFPSMPDYITNGFYDRTERYFAMFPAWSKDKCRSYEDVGEYSKVRVTSPSDLTYDDMHDLMHELHNFGFASLFGTVAHAEKENAIVVMGKPDHSIGYAHLINLPVEVSGLPERRYTLAELIDEFGIESESDPQDYRRFARCPRLKGLCGPSMPNKGYVARYDTWESYELLTR